MGFGVELAKVTAAALETPCRQPFKPLEGVGAAGGKNGIFWHTD